MSHAKPTSVRFTRYCTCGMSWVGSATPNVMEKLDNIWNTTHSGPAHFPTDSKGASKTRRREEALERKQELIKERES